MNSPRSRLFIFGMGYCARALARILKEDSCAIAGTCRDPEQKVALRREGYEVHLFPGGSSENAVRESLARAENILITIPPPAVGGDVVWETFQEDILHHPRLRWLGYLSTTGVYGNHDGDWVNEDSEVKPVAEHHRRRWQAETRWRESFHSHGVPVHVFRLAGVYGPGRNPLQKVIAGQARRIEKPGLVFGRVHVADVAEVLKASLARPHPGTIYNVCDDLPAPPAEVTEYACGLLNRPLPPLVAFERATLSEMGRSFYLNNRRVSNRRIKEELKVELRYPNYKDGLRALLKSIPEELKK